MHFVTMKSLHFFLSTVYKVKLCKVGLHATAGLRQLCQQMTQITVASRISSPWRKAYRWSLQKSSCLFRKKCFPQKKQAVVKEGRSDIYSIPPTMSWNGEREHGKKLAINKHLSHLSIKRSQLLLMSNKQ